MSIVSSDGASIGIDVSTVLKRVPPEYPLAWKWFEEKSGSRIARLPFGKGRPANMPMPLARQAAIHCPSYSSLPSGGAGKKRYALSIYSVGQSIYPDGKKCVGRDGTWTLNYHEQRGKDPHQDYNALLRNCMEDGVPVGVMVRSPQGGYDVLGLAAIEEYDALSHMFTLHGPVRMIESASSNSERSLQIESASSRGALANCGCPPQSRMSSADEQLRQFKSLVFDAYEGACAITEFEIPEVLDVAYIEHQQGLPSLAVSNGILLRADICRLFDSNLIAIAPGNNTVEVSHRLSTTGYGKLNGCEVRLPRCARLAPKRVALERRYRSFIEREMQT